MIDSLLSVGGKLGSQEGGLSERKNVQVCSCHFIVRRASLMGYYIINT